MKCNQIENIIPQLLRREVDSETRLDAITHLRECVHCRRIYLQYQNIFYSIDRNVVRCDTKIDMDSFSESVKRRINSLEQSQRSSRLYYPVYAAAAVLLIFVVIYSFSTGLFTSTPARSDKESISLKEHLEYENWQTLNSILQDPQKLKNYLDEKIPLFLLREKLIYLKNSGIHSISYTFPTTSDINTMVEIPVDELIVALNRYRQGSAASIRDLSKFEIII